MYIPIAPKGKKTSKKKLKIRKALPLLNKSTADEAMTLCKYETCPWISHPRYVFQTYVASFFTFSLHPCWLYVITSTLIIRQLCYGPTHVEIVGKQTQNRLVGIEPPPTHTPNSLVATWLISWPPLSLKAEVNPFKSVLYSKMLCYDLNLPVCLLSFVSLW